MADTSRLPDHEGGPHSTHATHNYRLKCLILCMQGKTSTAL